MTPDPSDPASPPSALVTRAPSAVTAPDERVVHFDGVCGIAAAESVRDRLLEALTGPPGRRVVIDCREVTEVDLTFLQLLLAARTQGQETGQTVVLAAPATGVLAEALVSAGMAHPDGTRYGWLTPFWAGA